LRPATTELPRLALRLLGFALLLDMMDSFSTPLGPVSKRCLFLYDGEAEVAILPETSSWQPIRTGERPGPAAALLD
jgi:hypothetical protein